MSMRPHRGRARGVLFDLDGTLLDTIPDLAEAARRMMLELGRTPWETDDIRRFVGKGIPNLVRRCLTEDGTASEEDIEAAVAVFRAHYTQVNGQQTTFYPQVRETLAALTARGVPMAVVTNKAATFTEALLTMTGLRGHFACVVSGDTLPVKKPDPAMLWLACEQLGMAVNEVVMVGDSANDALAAQAAGCPVLLLTYGYAEGRPVRDIPCDAHIDSLSSVLHWV